MTTPTTKTFNDKAPRNSTAPEAVIVPAVRGKDGTGYDIFSQVLNDTRTIFVGEGVGSGLAASVIAQLKYLESQNPEAPIQMIVNSPGGSVVDGLAIYDVMRQVKCKIVTVGIGMQASMGSIIMTGGDERIMAPDAKNLVHQGSGGREGTPSDMKIGAAFHETLLDRLKEVYQDHTGLTKEFWGIVLRADTWFTAQQALELGLVDGIAEVAPEKQPKYAADREPNSEFIAAKQEVVSKFKTAEQLASAINNDFRFETTDVAFVRPELAVALSKFPQFWTAGKKAEMQQAATVAGIANDNGPKKRTPRAKAAPKSPSAKGPDAP